VLIGTAGREGNVLKVRPPLAFSDADILVFVDALASTLGSIAAR
jgi:4-aminobutyrate aminotransferase-like enzyme